MRACREERFADLERLVIDHAPVVSGCICVLLSWDDQRQEFIRKLRMLGVPVLVLLLVEEEDKRVYDAGPMSAEPGRFHVLRLGDVERSLGTLRCE